MNITDPIKGIKCKKCLKKMNDYSLEKILADVDNVCEACLHPPVKVKKKHGKAKHKRRKR